MLYEENCSLMCENQYDMMSQDLMTKKVFESNKEKQFYEKKNTLSWLSSFFFLTAHEIVTLNVTLDCSSLYADGIP